MIPEEIKQVMENQGYRFVGNHSIIKICMWTKKSIKNEGVCFKEKFYGIKSHLCCQMSPWLACENHCIHCWRPIELDFNKLIKNREIDSPSEIIDECIKAQRKLLSGFNIDKNSKKKQLSKANMKKYLEAQEPMHFAISLSGEPTLYPQVGELISELRKRGKTSFLVTNGLNPEKIMELGKKKQLPTQFTISVNAPNEELYNKLSRSIKKDAWKKLNESLKIFSGLQCRTILRINLIRDFNMEEKHIIEYAELIKKTRPTFIHVKGYMAIGFARKRLGYDRMPNDKEMKIFVEKLATATGLKILDIHEFSRAWVLGENKNRLKIKD